MPLLGHKRCQQLLLHLIAVARIVIVAAAGCCCVCCCSCWVALFHLDLVLVYSRAGATQVGIMKCARHSLLADKFLAFPVGGSNTRQSQPDTSAGQSRRWAASSGECREGKRGKGKGEESCGGQLSGQIMLVPQSKWPSRHTLEFECVTI